MPCQRRDHEPDRAVSPDRDNAVGMLATTCKINNIIALPRPTGRRCGMGHHHCAAQYPRCLPDNCRLNFLAVTFRLRVEHHQVLHALPSPHRCLGTNDESSVPPSTTVSAEGVFALGATASAHACVLRTYEGRKALPRVCD